MCEGKNTSTGADVLLTGSDGGISPGLSMMISFFRSSSMVLLYVRRGDRRSLSDARSRGCPNTFFEFVSSCLVNKGKRGFHDLWHLETSHHE